MLPVLIHAVAGYDEGNMQEHILENIVVAFNNLCKGSSGSSREYRRYFVQLVASSCYLSYWKSLCLATYRQR